MIRLNLHNLPIILALTLGIISLGSRQALAQHAIHRGIPLSTAEYKQYNSLQLIQNEGTAQQRSDRLNLQGISLLMQAPIPLNGFDTLLIPTLKYDSIFAADDTPYPDLHLGSFEGSLALRQALGQGLAIVQMFSFGLTTDFESLYTYNFFGSGSIVLTKHVKQGLSFGGGVAITNTADFPIPIFLFHWCPHPSIWFTAALPRGLRLGYAPTQALEIALSARVNRYRVIMDGQLGATTINNTMLTAGAETQLHLGAGLHLGLNIGFTQMFMLDIEHTQRDQGKTRLIQAPWFSGVTFEYRVFPELPAKPLKSSVQTASASPSSPPNSAKTSPTR